MHSDKVTTTANEGRKSSKPIMEKRRRARINASLAELKSLLLEVIKKEGARHSKMEKADILEMTVKHLRQLQKQQLIGPMPSGPSIFSKYRLGFNECASEINRYLSSLNDVDVDLRARIISHLANCMTGVSSTSQPDRAADLLSSISGTAPSSPTTNQIKVATNVATTTLTVAARAPLQMVSGVTNGITALQRPTSSIASSYLSSPDVSSTQSIPAQCSNIFGGLQLIPTKLPSGEMAFVFPTNVIAGGHVPSYVIPVYASPSLNVGMIPPASTGTIIGQSVTLSSLAIPSGMLPNASPGSISTTSQTKTVPVLTENKLHNSSLSTGSNPGVRRPVLEHSDVSMENPGTSEGSISHGSVQTLGGASHVDIPVPVANTPERGDDDDDASMWRPWLMM